MMRTTTVSEAIKQYVKTTTLHGFKYLYSAYYVDRVGWLLCCCASACCASMLCAVLWARFSDVPAVLTLWDNLSSDEYIELKVPAVVVCPPTESVAEMFLDKLSRNKSATQRIPITLARLLTGKSTAREQLQLLNDLLVANNLTLPEVMMNYTPNCSEHTKKCRYQEVMVPCERLFKKELTIWGVCCLMRPKKNGILMSITVCGRVRYWFHNLTYFHFILKNLTQNLLAKTHTTEILELLLQCTQGSTLYGCQFLTIYESEENVHPGTLLPGYYYMAQLRFTAIPDNSAAENLMESTCVHSTGYSRTICKMKCAERLCGCSDPFLSDTDHTRGNLPMCPVTRMGCLRTTEYGKDATCNCLPSCSKITTYMVLQSAPMNFVEHTIDPLYAGINVTASIVINLRVNVGHSRIYVLNPTVTWFTLLASLGGVFNMFLGVGLFSALEFFFLVLVKLPTAIKKSPEMNPTTAYTAPVVRY